MAYDRKMQNRTNNERFQQYYFQDIYEWVFMR